MLPLTRARRAVRSVAPSVAAPAALARVPTLGMIIDLRALARVVLLSLELIDDENTTRADYVLAR